MKKNLKIFLVTTLLINSSCTMAPWYKKPKVDLPFADASNPSKEKIALISWQKYFASDDLKRVIQLALDNNRDLRVANINIESAQGAYGVSRANLLPSVGAVGLETKQGVPGAFASFTPRKQFRANLTLTSYEVDFFGRLRSLKKSAAEDFLATEEARNVTKISLICETANAYAQLLLDQELLKIAEENLKAQSDRYKFVELRYKKGIDSQTDLLNATALIENSKINFENYKKIVEQDKASLMLLTGVFDEKSLPKITTIDEIKIAENLLDFVPSKSLLLRPDIKQAEHALKSANANIGAARAAFFPSITLTGNYGYGSRSLDTLFDSRSWTFSPQINLPIFSGGRNFANLTIANARKKIEIANYEKAIQVAFREALDQLAERRSIANQLNSYDEILKARQKNYNFSEKKHQAGINSALNVLDDQITLLTAKQSRAMAKKEYLANLITLYKVMGGGSEVESDK